MSVIVCGMEMPKNCDECLFDNGVNCMAYPQSEDMVYDIADGKPDWCPLIELPAQHGRLIDEDALLDRIDIDADITFVINAILDAPAIVEAEAGET